MADNIREVQNETSLSAATAEAANQNTELNWLNLTGRFDARTEPREPAKPGDNAVSPAQGWETFLERIKASFKDIDRGSKGYVDRSDAYEYYKRTDLKGVDAGVAVVLYKYFEEISGHTDKLKLEDLQPFDKVVAGVRKDDGATDCIEANADAILAAFADKSSGRLTRESLAGDSKIDPKLKDRASLALEYIKNNFDKIQHVNCDLNDEGIALDDLQKHVYNYRAHPESQIQAVRRIDSFMQRAAALSSYPQELFRDKEHPERSIVPTAVAQGDVGDCYFLSSAASLAELDPVAIRKMIEPNPDHTFTVTLPLSPDEHYKVDPPTDQELLVYAHGTEHGYWPAVLEKGYGAWIKSSIWRRSLLNPVPSDVLQENADGGSSHHHGLFALMGGFPTETTMSKETPDSEIAKALQTALEAKQPITTSRTSDFDTYDLPLGHEYSLLRFNPKDSMVTIRNPWGHGEPLNAWGRAKDGRDDGIFTMPVSEFKTRFHDFAVGRKAPPTVSVFNIEDLKLPQNHDK